MTKKERDQVAQTAREYAKEWLKKHSAAALVQPEKKVVKTVK